MKISSTVWKEAGHIALGVLVGDLVMLAVFTLLMHKTMTLTGIKVKE